MAPVSKRLRFPWGSSRESSRALLMICGGLNYLLFFLANGNDNSLCAMVFYLSCIVRFGLRIYVRLFFPRLFGIWDLVAAFIFYYPFQSFLSTSSILESHCTLESSHPGSQEKKMNYLIFSGLLLNLVSAVPSIVGNITIRGIGSLDPCSYYGVCGLSPTRTFWSILHPAESFPQIPGNCVHTSLCYLDLSIKGHCLNGMGSSPNPSALSNYLLRTNCDFQIKIPI